LDFFKRHSLSIGLALMFALTWPLYAKLGLFVGYGLAAACLIVTALTRGTAGIMALLRRFLLWRVAAKWYAVVLALPIALYTTAMLLQTILSGAPPDFANTTSHTLFGDSPRIWLFIVPFFLVDAVTNGEELAWRGFVLPRYQTRFNALTSSLLVGVIWGVWHLPRVAPYGAWAIAHAILHNVAVAVVFTWVYNSTRGSLLLVTLLHAAFNTAYVFLPVAPTAAGATMMSGVLLVVEYLAAAAVVIIARPSALSRLPRVVE
jgi:membrane protease YdiL (CAAX protease family)